MQNLLSREEYFEVVSEDSEKTEIKISEDLLDFKDDSSFEDIEEMIRYEIKLEFEESSEIKNNYESSDRKSKKYVMHTPEIKRQCVEMAMSTDAKTAAKTFGVPLKSLKRWVAVGPERRKGGGRKIRDPEMERRLYEWYYDLHLVKKLQVTSRMIKSKALELTSLKDFNASKGWLEKIKKKYNLQISRSSALKK